MVKSHFTIKQRLTLSGWSDCFERLVLDMDTAVRDSTFLIYVCIYCSQVCDCRINKAVNPKTHKIRDWNSDNLHKFCSLLVCNSEAE